MITPGNCDKAEFATKLRKSSSLQNTYFKTWFQYCSANVSSYNATIQRMIQAHIWKRDQENIFTCVEVRGRTSGTHTAVARLASALASGHLSFGKISHKIFQISGSGVKVRSKGKVKGIVRPKLLSAGQQQVGGGHEISYTCLISFPHLGMCDWHAQTAARLPTKYWGYAAQSSLTIRPNQS